MSNIVHLQHIEERGSLCGQNKLSTYTTANIEEVTCKNCLKIYNKIDQEKIDRYNKMIEDTWRKR